MNNTVEEQLTESKKGMMNRKTIIFAAIAIVLLAGGFLFYFFYLQNPSRKILAQVNDEKITLEQFNKEIVKVEPPLMRDMFREEPNNLLERMIMRALLLQEAKKQGVSAPVKTYKDAAKNSLSPDDSMIIEFIDKKFSPPPEVKREEVERFYKTYKDKMEGKPLKEVAPMIEQLQKITAKPPEINSEDDLKQALTSGKPVLVDFGANACIPCRQMRPVLKEVRTEYSEKAKILIIDVYKNQNLAQEYKVLMLPTLVFFDSKGKETFRNVGIMEKEKIVGKLKEIGMGT
jgi:thioredoxin 1